jgi:hypothetical protein
MADDYYSKKEALRKDGQKEEAARLNPAPPPFLIEAGNIDLSNRPIVKNADGTYSTVRSITIPMDEGTPDESWFNIPTIGVTGERLYTAKPDGSEDTSAALQEFLKTKQHLGRYKTRDAAIAAAQQIHEDQAKQYDEAAAAAKP